MFPSTGDVNVGTAEKGVKKQMNTFKVEALFCNNLN